MSQLARRLFANVNFTTSLIVTITFLVIGVAALYYSVIELGWVLFVVLPVLLGIPGGLSKNPAPIIIGTILGLMVVFVLILIYGFSGLICMVLWFPLLIPLVLVGMCIGVMIKIYRNAKKEMKKEGKLYSVFLPFLIFFIAAPVEKAIDNNSESVVEVRTERIYNYTPEEVFDAIKSVDTLDAPKSFLMSMDLPIPTKCILEREAVGAKRTCYFDQGNMSFDDFGAGTITEEVTEIERGKILKMKVISYELVGRKWIGFRDAIYYFEAVGENQCKLTRVTTYTSVLKPRIYWEPLEKMSIQEEHDYVLDNLQKDLDEQAVAD